MPKRNSRSEHKKKKRHHRTADNKEEIPRRVQVASKPPNELEVGIDSLSELVSNSEIITASSPTAVSPRLGMSDSFIRKSGWQDTNGIAWTTMPPKDECALLGERIVGRDCVRTTYGRDDSKSKQKGQFMPMDDVELLYRGIVSKGGDRQRKKANVTKEMDLGRFRGLPESKEIIKSRKYGQLVTPSGQCSTTNVNAVDCFSAEQFHRRVRSLSLAKQKPKSQRSRTLGTILCEVGEKGNSATLDYTISDYSRTYTLKDIVDESGEAPVAQLISLEFGTQRSFLNIVSGDASARNR